MKKGIAVTLLEAEVGRLKREIIDREKECQKVVKRNKELVVELNILQNTIGIEVKQLRKETECVRALKDTLEDVVMSAEGSPTVYTGIAYIVKLLQEIKNELLRGKV